MNKNTLLKGTLILTLTGFITRFIGFFYRIYLSNELGAEQMGIYQLIFPIYGICFTLYASGIQTALSKLIAGAATRSERYRTLFTALLLSLITALSLSILVYTNATYLAVSILKESRCINCLRVLALAFPFCGITACINGYYYGLKKAAVPATTQLLEQIIRVVSVYLIASYIGKNNPIVTCELAVLGIVLGEVASNLYNIFSLLLTKQFSERKQDCHEKHSSEQTSLFIPTPLLKLSIPLTTNRLLTSMLQSFETILIPTMLRKSGLSTAEALSIYGILTGMSIPFIMFPSTITNSFAVLLLPTVSEAQSSKNNALIKKTTAISIKYSCMIGILSTGIFILFGKILGIAVFHNPLAGAYLQTLAWLCPFLYLATTLSSIINGLGKTYVTFFNTTTGLCIRILFVIFCVPNYGIWGYLIGLLVSELTIAILDIIATYHAVHFPINVYDWVVKPALTLTIIGFLIGKAFEFFVAYSNLSIFLLLFIAATILTLCYLIILCLLGVISIKEFKE